jgi:hypothetical protein
MSNKNRTFKHKLSIINSAYGKWGGGGIGEDGKIHEFDLVRKSKEKVARDWFILAFHKENGSQLKIHSACFSRATSYTVFVRFSVTSRLFWHFKSLMDTGQSDEIQFLCLDIYCTVYQIVVVLEFKSNNTERQSELFHYPLLTSLLMLLLPLWQVQLPMSAEGIRRAVKLHVYKTTEKKHGPLPVIKGTFVRSTYNNIKKICWPGEFIFFSPP